MSERSTRDHQSGQVRRLAAAALAVLTAALGLAVVTTPTAQAAAVSPAAMALPGSGFPGWYEDNNGNRVEPCLDVNDANCGAPPPASDTYDPNLPLSWPSNYPDEFFYTNATSEKIATPGCGASPPGRAFVTMATEAAFANGAPAAGDQMTFGRVRFRVTSGLCAGQTYQFRYPFGTVSFVANGAGAVPVNTPGATTDTGCVPTVLVPCNFALAGSSPVFGGATTGFLRWDPAVLPAAPAGYLGDGATPHRIVGATGTGINAFEVSGPDGLGGTWTGSTTDFVVVGKLIGSLVSTPQVGDFGGQVVGVSSPQKVITVTNLDKVAVSIGGGGGVRLRNANAAFTVNSTTCRNVTLARGQTCTVTVSFRPSVTGPTGDFVDIAYTGGLAGSRSPLGIALTGVGLLDGSRQPVITANPTAVGYGDVRIRTTANRTITLTNSGTAPLSVSGATLTDTTLGADTSQYRLTSNTCVGATTIPVGGSCALILQYAPGTRGPHPITLVVASNVSGGITTIPVTGTGTGGVAAVSASIDPTNGFPDWYRDENGVKVAQCLDPRDPYCIVLGDATFDPARPVNFLAHPDQALNFPGEFFWMVADSDLLTTPGCNGTAPGRAAMRVAFEGTFVNGEPVVDEQMAFGRVRFYATGGLCPNTTYTFTTPYGQTTATTNAKGAIGRSRGTQDIGCAPAPPDRCDFADALSAPVAGGVLRWDPAVAPAAPAGYLGDATSMHRVVGAPYREDGVTPSNYFKITGPGITGSLSTNLFSVMGKLRGPLEATDGLTDGAVVLADTPVGSTSTPSTLTLTNTGVAVGASTGDITVSGLSTTGPDASEFAVVGGADTCTGATLAPGASCEIDLTFSPVDTGRRTAGLRVAHSGLNNPLVVPLVGTGQAPGPTPAISFAPRSLAFGQLGLGSSSPVETVVVSNAGGQADLEISDVTIAGATPGAYGIVEDRCEDPVAPGASCEIDVVFSPIDAGAQNASLVLTDNAPGGTHSVSLTARGFAGTSAVSATLDRHGFPRWYQDGNGLRLEPCLQAVYCVPFGGTYDPAQPAAIGDNFPDEFFYALADSEIVTVPGCNGGPDGTALLRLGLEGSFIDGAPAPGDQMTFTRIRLIVRGGLCPNAQGYQAVTPYGVLSFDADANGSVVATAGTQDTGCGAAPCAFGDALASPGTLWTTADTPSEGFLRVDPATATAPEGFLGDAQTFTRVTGGTYVEPGETGAFDAFEIRDPADNVLAGTELFAVSGKIAGPLNADASSLDFGNVDQGTQSATQTVTVTNVGGSASGVTPTLTGADAGQFALAGGTCAAGNQLAQDATCTVVVRFAPPGSGAKNASLVLSPTSGPTEVVALTGVANPVAQPAITVTPGVLGFGTVAAPGAPTLTTQVANTGTGPLNVSAAAITGGGGDFTLAAGTCAAPPFTLLAGEQCTIGVAFRPSVIGARTGTLTLSHNAAGATTTVALSGTGAGAAWSVSPNPVGFGSVNRNTTKTSTLSVRNTGTAAGRITAATVSGLPFGVIVNPATSTCLSATTVAAGRSCSISVTFRPTVVGAVSGTLTLDGGGGSLPRLTTVTMTGTGK